MPPSKPTTSLSSLTPPLPRPLLRTQQEDRNIKFILSLLSSLIHFLPTSRESASIHSPKKKPPRKGKSSVRFTIKCSAKKLRLGCANLASSAPSGKRARVHAPSFYILSKVCNPFLAWLMGHDNNTSLSPFIFAGKPHLPTPFIWVIAPFANPSAPQTHTTLQTNPLHLRPGNWFCS